MRIVAVLAIETYPLCVYEFARIELDFMSVLTVRSHPAIPTQIELAHSHLLLRHSKLIHLHRRAWRVVMRLMLPFLLVFDVPLPLRWCSIV